MPIYEESNSSVSFHHIKNCRFHRDEWPNGIDIRDPQIKSNANGPLNLLRVHIHRLSENSGVIIVVRISHSVFGAKGCVAFMSCWAEICRRRLNPGTSEITIEPLIDRSGIYKYLPKDIQQGHSLVDPRTWLSLLFSLLIRLLLALYVLFPSKQAAPDLIESHLFRLSRPVLNNPRDEVARLQPESPRVSDNDIAPGVY